MKHYYSLRAVRNLSSSTVPWLEPSRRWEHPCCRGDRGLSGHLYLHALQCPGLHGMVPSCSPGAKGKHIVTAALLISSPVQLRFYFIVGHVSYRAGPSQILSGSWWGVQAGGWPRTGHPLWGRGRPLSQHHMEKGETQTGCSSDGSGLEKCTFLYSFWMLAL